MFDGGVRADLVREKPKAVRSRRDEVEVPDCDPA
jgi:hypothetical protein